jgi:hypothetical protein
MPRSVAAGATAGVTSEATKASSLLRGESAALPWFLPGVAISAAVSLAVGGIVGRALGARRIVASALVFSLGIIVSATLTPLGGRVDLVGSHPGACDLSRMGLPPLADLLGVNDTSLNVLLFVPLGLSLAFLPRSRRTAAVILAAVALPFAIELTQLMVPVLDRGCESADVVDNLAGLVLGLAAGTLLGRLVPAAHGRLE